ncbi:MAG: DUF4013 domain-containing protein [Haloferacaceae archaeon]
MLNDALRFPMRRDGWLRTVVVGGVLALLSLLVLPAIVLQGYVVRVFRVATADVGPGESRELPRFSDWGALLADGVKLLAVNVVYSLVVVVPLGLVVAGIAALAGSTGRRGALLAGVIGLAFGSVVLIFGLVVAFVAPAAYANFAIEGRLAAAFDVETIRRGVFTPQYVSAWIYATLVAVVGGTIGTALSVAVVGVFLLFYAQVVAAFLFGRGFATGLAATAE